jgi:RNA polymerase sigma-70 factor (ECF subfamily)
MDRVDGAINDLMARHLAGDRCAFEHLYRKVAPRLHAYALRRTRDEAVAEDLVQTVLWRMARARFRSGADVMAWAVTIAHRILIDWFRRAQRQVEVTPTANVDTDVAAPAGVCDPERAVQVREAATRLHHELAALPAGQRTAFELLKYEGISVAEAASRLRTTGLAVRLRAHRAARALRSVCAEAAF